MRFLLFLLLAPMGVLLAPNGALAQSTPYYLADGLEDFSDQQIRGTNPIFVTKIGPDSLIISTSAQAYEHASFYKKTSGETFYRRKQEWGTSMPNFIFADENVLMLVEERGSYLLFHKDRNTAAALLGAGDKTAVLRIKDSVRAVVVAINSAQRSKNDAAAAAQNKKIVTAYIRSIHSKRSDPTLVSDIKKWSQNATTTVYIVDADYYITRNYRGEVLNKNIPALIKYHLNGKCFVQWRAFGYEALGGGSFTKDLYTYNKQDYYLQATGAGGSLRLEPGVAYEIDCD